ncbi:heavy metal translocating P-type ATPase [Halovulum sp. GXIMD14793]
MTVTGMHPPTSRITLPVSGMHCASCAGRVEAALGAVPGVADASVNLALETAAITFDPARVSPDNLVNTVTEAGFESRLPEDTTPADKDHADGLTELILAAALTLPLLAQMVAMWLGLGWHLPPWAELALAAPVQFIIGRQFYIRAWAALKARTGTMDHLVVMGTSAAFFYSLWVLLRDGAAATGHLYFEASAVVITLVLAGKFLEARAKTSAAAALRTLLALRPESAQVLRDGQEITLPASDILMGDTVILRPGERLAVDGVVLDGDSELDESLVTGEPLPVLRRPGDPVIAGAINGTGRILVRAERIGADTTLARIAQMVADAQTGKAPVQRLIDRISAVFVPVVLGIAALTLLGWILAGAGFEPALVAAISVLVIACPCALGLATPTALVAGTGAAAKAGILIKDIDTLERAGRIDLVVFDKTGTLTEGKPTVTDILAFNGTNEALLATAAAVQIGSEHPLGKAIVQAAEARNRALPDAADIHARVGAGIEGRVDDEQVRIGTHDFAAPDADEASAAALTEQGKTVVWVARSGTALGLIALTDQPRPDAKAAIQSLKARGIRTVLLTGDAESTASEIGEKLGLDEVCARMRPEDKATAIQAFAAAGAKTAMIGDGINDAPALAAADLGIAMGSGTDVALQTAGVTLMRPRPSLVAATLDIARATAAKIRQNLFWAFAYNVVLIPVAALGYLSPMLAGLAMALSSVSVVSNSLLLKRWRPS